MREFSALVVEDEAISALWMKSMVKSLGFRVVGVAGKGEDAINLAMQNDPGILFLDIRLAGTLDGIDVAKKVLEKLNPHIVFVSAYAEEAFSERLKGINTLGILRKPFGQSELEDLLRKHNLLPTELTKVL